MRHASNIVEPYEMTVSPKCTFLSSIYDTETFYIILLFVPFFFFIFFFHLEVNVCMLYVLL